MDTGHQTQHGVGCDDGAAAVADQGQGQADNRHCTDAHTDVDHHLEHHGKCRTEAHHAAHIK